MKVEHYYKPDSKTLREEPQVFTRWIDPTIEQLQQENKQLKEELESKNKMYWQQQCAYYSSILYSLEEWLKETRINSAFIDEQTIMEVQLKIQELKEKYK